MSECPDCGLPLKGAPTPPDVEACSGRRSANGRAACSRRTIALLRSKLSATEAKLVEAERENKAWRALAEHAASENHPVAYNRRKAVIPASVWLNGRHAYGGTFGIAAIDLATKLGLMVKEGG